ncbi:prevent-host-death family protein [Dethiosulfatibacter aminovorans DSM 17477]|uniref:Antitoxin n=1 Tax=Dethiosulfatibacter aminovorans DSM 17477 TaxID=1121476 RepID=A0A1M6J0F7_9FIRM|nr:type II toxin-antitoxin system Phd/YefM family antitoxin [Dethiosulfatibacter aminovorans]SHJ40188.1 prevent-host-death family protein [Dethiosulfatibacter aminovorans DSM 17477]
MLKITSTELKQNLGKYLTIVNKEEIIITRNGIPVAKLTIPTENEMNLVSQLIGVIPDDGYTIEDSRKERLLEDESNN